jgi:molybdenum cofactor cytidylyltransferase
MGCFKPLMAYGKTTVIQKVVDTVAEFVELVIVVIGDQGDQIHSLTDWGLKVCFVKNPDPARGMLSSVQIGAARVQAPYFFLVLGDQPHVPGTVYQKLLESSPAEARIPTFSGQSGHPLLLSSAVKQKIISKQVDDPQITLRTILKGVQQHLVEVAEDAILYDMDTRQQYDDIVQKYSREC